MARIVVPPELEDWAMQCIVPCDPSMVNPASIDLRIGNQWKNPKTGQEYTGNYRLGVGCSVLGITLEEIRVPPEYAADLKLKTTLARYGVNHSLAGWVDPGYEGKLTLTLYTIDRSVLLRPGMRIAQVVVWRLDDKPLWDYRQVGNYMHQQEPTEAHEYLLEVEDE